VDKEYRLQDSLVPLRSHMIKKANKVREVILAIEHRRAQGMEVRDIME
jgi:hypothetical protein